MEENIFTSEYDKLFLKTRGETFSLLEKRFSPTILQAKNREWIVGEIRGEVLEEQRKKLLYDKRKSLHPLRHEITYKARKYFDKYIENPILYFLNEELPKILLYGLDTAHNPAPKFKPTKKNVVLLIGQYEGYSKFYDELPSISLSLKGKKSVIGNSDNGENASEPPPPLSNEDTCIKGKLSKEEIEKYFMQLTKIHSDYPMSKKELICVLTATQIKELLTLKHNNLKFDTPNFLQQQLRIFIYHFKKLHKSRKNTVMDFVNFEINYFKVFEGLLPEKEYRNFNKGNVLLKPPYDSVYTNKPY